MLGEKLDTMLIKREAGTSSGTSKVRMIVTIAFAVFAVAAAAVIIGTISSDSSDAAVNDTFDIGNLTYTVTKETETAKEVSVSASAAFPTTGDPVAVVIPATVTNETTSITYDVVSIKANGFQDKDLLSSVDLGSVRSIGYSAFSQCDGLTAVNIPLSVTSIGHSAFLMCSNLTTLTIADWESPNEDQKLTIPQSCFSNTKIAALTIPDRVISIGNYAFKDTKITQLVIPANVTSIGDYAFQYDKLTQLTIQGMFNTDGSNTKKPFYGAGSANGFTVTIEADANDDVTLSNYIFAGSNISSLVFSGRSLSVGANAFDGCTRLPQMPSSVVSVSESAFKGCTLFSSVSLTNEMTVAQGAFENCTGIRTITTEGAVTLGADAFKGCTGLESVVLSSGTVMADADTENFAFPGWTFRDSGGAMSLGESIKGHSYQRIDASVLGIVYTVSFDVGGLATAIDPQTVTVGSTVTCPTTGNTLPGLDTTYYVFDGKWHTVSASGSEWSFDSGVTGDMTLYAGISGIPCRLELNSCGGTPVNPIMEIPYGTAIGDIEMIEMTWTGYDFLGYFTEAEDGTKVVDAELNIISGIDGWTVGGKWVNIENGQKLYAQWRAHTYTLTIKDSNDATVGSGTIIYGGNEIEWVSEPVPPAHHSIEGIYTSSAMTTKVIGADGKTLESVIGWTDDTRAWYKTEDSVLYLKWEPSKTELTLSKNNGDLGSDDGSAWAVYGSGLTDYDSATRYGHTLLGYFTEATGGTKIVEADGTLCAGTAYTDSDKKWTGTDASLTLYAHWEAKTYTVTIDAAGGTGSYQFQVTFGTTNDVPDFTDSFSKTGNHISWRIVDNKNTEVISHEVVVATGENQYHFVRHNMYIDDDMRWVFLDNLTLYLTWSPNVYNGILSADGKGTDGSFEITYGFNTLNVTHATRVGYDNAGYFTEPNGGGIYALTGNLESTYYIAHNLPGLTDADGKWIYAGTEPATLYATWTAQAFPITIDKNGGETDGWYQASYMADHMIVVADVVRAGYKLSGIYTDADCTEANQLADKDGRFLNKTIDGIIQDGKWICLIDDKRFYAKWEIANVPVIDNGSTIAFSDDTAETVVIVMSTIESSMADASKTEVVVRGDGWKMDIPKEILSGVSGNVSVGAKSLTSADIESLPADVKTILTGKTVYSLSLSDSNGAISFNGRSVTVSLPYTLKEGENASDVKVFFINAENKAEQVDARYDADTKCAVFTTTHFSTWYVDATADGSGSNGGFPVWVIFVIIAVVAAAGAGAFFVMKKKA